MFDALSFVHKKHQFHGNLHPGNILVTEQNEFLITDFGRLTTKCSNEYSIEDNLNQFDDKDPQIVFQSRDS